MSLPIVRGARTDGNGLRKVTRYEFNVPPTVNDDSYDDVEVGTVWAVIGSDKQISALYLCTDATAGAAVWKQIQSDNNYRSELFIEEVITFTGSASKNMATQLPVNAIPKYALANNESAIDCTTAVKIGIGTDASLVGFGITAALTKNTKQAKSTGALTGVQLLAATTVQISAVDTGGAAAGTADSGTYRVRVYYELYDQLADAP